MTKRDFYLSKKQIRKNKKSNLKNNQLVDCKQTVYGKHLEQQKAIKEARKENKKFLFFKKKS